jgi:hypothetical protein
LGRKRKIFSPAPLPLCPISSIISGDMCLDTIRLNLIKVKNLGFRERS